jgi:predicted DNA-binding transcriptional regulator AlpA
MKDSAQSDKYLTEKQAAEFLGISSAGLRKARCTGALPGQRPLPPYYRVGPKTIRYLQSELHEFMQQFRVEPRPWSDIEGGAS